MEFSPMRIIRFKQFSFIVFTHLSANEFKLALRRGSRIVFKSVAFSISLNSFVKHDPWSCIKSPWSFKNPSMQSVRFRPICFIHSPWGSGIIPAIWTSLAANFITNNTWYRINPFIVQISTVKKSVAAITSQCCRRNSFHGSPFFRPGLGSIPACSRIVAIVVLPTSCLKCSKAPWILVYPQCRFSEANFITNSLISSWVVGLPTLLFRLES